MVYSARTVKGERLREFEEFSLLAIRALADQAYGVAVQQYIERHAARPISMGAVYAALDRLERKGFVRSALGAATPERGGKRKRLYDLTPAGAAALREARRVRDAMWRAVVEPGRGRS